MTQTNYKEIAKIIKEGHFDDFNGRRITANKLSDHFERENPKSNGIHRSSLSSIIWYCNNCKYQVKPSNICRCIPFNPKEFKEDCGVE